jgi:hypothetical protein
MSSYNFKWFSLVGVFNYKTLIITSLSVATTFMCVKFNITAKFPDLLIGMAIVFPVVFSISSAFTRREFALQRFSEFKGHLISIYFAFKYWPFESSNSELTNKVKVEIHTIFSLFTMMLVSRETWKLNEKKIYEHFKNLSLNISELRSLNVQSGEISRVNQYISKIIISFDSMRSVHLYRTPIALRMFSRVFIYSFPLLYAPYFAEISKDYHPCLIYVMPLLYSFILISLNNIQEQLENPFDSIGVDDIIINVDEETFMLE